MKRREILLPALALLLVWLTGCGTSKKITYMQDLNPGVGITLQEVQSIRFEPGDRLKIVVHSRDKDAAKIFNLLDNTGQGNGHHSYYTIDEKGYIDIPVLGSMKVAGRTREEVVNEIKSRLINSEMIKDPSVTIEYEDMGYAVIGEVKSPGRKLIQRDHITLLDAIAEAGDLTIDGKRDNILVLRTEDGVQTPYRVNLLETKDLYSSPVYYIQQNDVIYVEPNARKSNTSTANGNTFLTPGFWMSTASFLMSVILLILR